MVRARKFDGMDDGWRIESVTIVEGDISLAPDDMIKNKVGFWTEPVVVNKEKTEQTDVNKDQTPSPPDNQTPSPPDNQTPSPLNNSDEPRIIDYYSGVIYFVINQLEHEQSNPSFFLLHRDPCSTR